MQDVKSKVPNVAFDVWRSRNVTLHLNEKHVLFQSRDISGIYQSNVFSYNQKKSEQSSKRQFWNVLNVVLESLCSPFGEIAQYFSDGL